MPRSRNFLVFALLLVLLLPAGASAGALEGPRTTPEGLLARAWNALVQPLTALWAASRGTMDPNGSDGTADAGSTRNPDGFTANSGTMDPDTDSRGTMDPNG